MLSKGRAPTLASLLALAPPQPLGVTKDDVWHLGNEFDERSRQSWYASALKMCKRYEGYQPAHFFRERMKYSGLPREDAPLADFVRARINHARALWSAEIGAKRTRRQFADWLPTHLDFRSIVSPLWPDGGPGPMGGFNDNWTRSFQILRLASGLPHVVQYDPRRGQQ